jgi:hypothetical protein
MQFVGAGRKRRLYSTVDNEGFDAGGNSENP